MEYKLESVRIWKEHET